MLRQCSCCAVERGRQLPLDLPKPLSRELLPDVKKLKWPPSTPFTKTLFNREYALIMNELFALREGLFGSKALIARIAEGMKPTDLRNIIACRQDMAWSIFMRVYNYVLEAAWCDAGARYRGLLPAAPEVPVVPYVTALKAKEMDWSELFEYIERERKEGILVGNADWADPRGDLRKRVLRALGALNSKFSESSAVRDCDTRRTC